MKTPYTYIWVLWIVLVFALIYTFQSSPSNDRLPEWDNHPIETKEYLDELIHEQQKIYAEADEAMKEARKVELALILIRDEKLEAEWLQVKEKVKTIVLEDTLEVPVVESRFIPWGKVIPSWITWNTKEKRFHNFVAHFARWFDSSVFVEARNRYGVKEEVLACIAWADSDMGKCKQV